MPVMEGGVGVQERLIEMLVVEGASAEAAPTVAAVGKVSPDSSALTTVSPQTEDGDLQKAAGSCRTAGFLATTNGLGLGPGRRPI